MHSDTTGIVLILSLLLKVFPSYSCVNLHGIILVSKPVSHFYPFLRKTLLKKLYSFRSTNNGYQREKYIIIMVSKRHTRDDVPKSDQVPVMIPKSNITSKKLSLTVISILKHSLSWMIFWHLAMFLGYCHEILQKLMTIDVNCHWKLNMNTH